MVGILALFDDTTLKNNKKHDVSVLLQIIETLKETTEDLRGTIESTNQANQHLIAEVKLLREQVAYLTDKRFGRSKETVSNQVSGQLSLFSEDQPSEETRSAEIPATQTAGDIEVKQHRRKAGQKAAKIAHLPVIDQHHTLAEEDRICDQCGSVMTDIGSTQLRDEILFHQAALDRLIHHQHTYCCKTCDHAGIPSFKKAPVPKPLIPNSLGSNSLVTQTALMKFEQKLPCYRQVEYWQRVHGLAITRDNIANWHILAVKNALDPIAERLKYYLCQETILHADETTYRVINSQKEKTYYWQFCSNRHGKQAIVYYHHSESRAGSVPKAFLKDFSGYLHCDGYTGYNEVADVSLVYCFAHVRRKFFDAIPKKHQNEDIPAVTAVKLCDVLFELERGWRDLTPEERLIQRHLFLRPYLINFYDWLGTITPVPKSKLDRAIQYACNHREGIERLLEDGRLELSNSISERHIKELVIGRKNWLQSTSLEGARTTGIFLSIIRTAKANQLDPGKYLTFLFERIPNLEVLTAEALDQCLPWAEEVQRLCRATYSFDKQ